MARLGAGLALDWTGPGSGEDSGLPRRRNADAAGRQGLAVAAQDPNPSNLLDDLCRFACPCCWLACSAALCQVHYWSGPKKPAVNYILKTFLHTSLSLALFRNLTLP